MQVARPNNIRGYFCTPYWPGRSVTCLFLTEKGNTWFPQSRLLPENVVTQIKRGTPKIANDNVPSYYDRLEWRMLHTTSRATKPHQSTFDFLVIYSSCQKAASPFDSNSLSWHPYHTLVSPWTILPPGNPMHWISPAQVASATYIGLVLSTCLSQQNSLQTHF